MKGPIILIVEDDHAIQDMAKLVLETEGYSVLTAGNGLEALQTLEQAKPELILLDMKMPLMDGWGFAAEYRRRFAHPVPLIVMTAASDAKKRAKDVDAVAYLGKPFGIEELISKVAEVLNNRQS